MRKNCFSLCYLLSIISGILASAAFTVEYIWWIIFFSLIPLCFAVQKVPSQKILFKCILFFSLSYYFPLLLWLYEVTDYLSFGILNTPMLSIGLLILVIIQGLCLSAVLCVFYQLRKNTVMDIFTFPLLFILGEWFQEKIPILPFPWGRIGVCTTAFIPFIQSASLFGSLFISFIVVAINCSLTLMIVNIKNKDKLKPIAAALMILFIGNISFGMIRLYSSSENSEKFNVVLVQGNFNKDDKWSQDPLKLLTVYDTMTRLSVTASTKLVVWPETAIPVYLEDNINEKEKIIKLAKEKNITVITGVKNKSFEPERTYNSMLAISPQGTISEPYNKQILVPFGEVLPFEKLLKIIPKIFSNFSSYAAGDESMPIKTTLGNLGSVICYESIFPAVSRKSVQNGAEILIILSNDSWFGKSAALHQHHAHAIMRAVENERYVLRAGNTGITSVISPYGKITATADRFIKTALTASASLETKRTLYSYTGDIIVLFSTVIFILGLIKYIRCKLKLVNHNDSR